MVVAEGVRSSVPDKATAPIPWSMLTEVAPDVLQVNLDVWPAEISIGLVENAAVMFRMLNVAVTFSLPPADLVTTCVMVCVPFATAVALQGFATPTASLEPA